MRLAELIETPTAARPARQLEHNGSADGLLADVQTRRALSVSFRSAAVHIRARSDRLTSKHVHTQPELPRRTLNRTLCITSLVNCGIRTQYGERFESLRCFNGVVSALVNLADMPNAARLRLIYYLQPSRAMRWFERTINALAA